MKKIFFLLSFLLLVISFKFPFFSFAQQKVTITSEKLGEEVVEEEPVETSSPSGETEEATEAALPIKKVEKKPDITEPEPETLGKLEKILKEHPLKPLNLTNFLQHGIRETVKKGVPANTIVLLLLFPLVAAIIAASRHIVGIRGFGIFLPAVLSVVFVATGIIEGLILFITIIFVATGGRMLLRKMKLQYLPRVAFVLWFVSLGVLAVLFFAPALNLTTLITLSIFPILILILLAEDFFSIQIGMSMKQAIRITFETLVIALICSSVLKMEFLQKFVLLNPELVVLGIALLDIFMGRYTGLRLLEYKKFKEIIK